MKALAGLTLRLQRIELLLESLLGGFAGIDRAANPDRLLSDPMTCEQQEAVALRDTPVIVVQTLTDTACAIAAS